MSDLLSNSLFFGVFLSVAAYEFGALLRKKLKWSLLNPLLISIVVVIAVLVLLHIDYDAYEEGAQYLSYFLTPATVCLAIPLYEQFELLKQNWKAILSGILAGAITSAACVLGLSVLLGLDHEMYVTLLPKSITTAIGMGVSEELDGVVTITVAAIVLTGVLGNIIADMVYRLFKVTEPVAKGVGLGSSAHAIGTARAMEMGDIEGAMSSLSIAVSGILTVIVAPVFANLF